MSDLYGVLERIVHAKSDGDQDAPAGIMDEVIAACDSAVADDDGLDLAYMGALGDLDARSGPVTEILDAADANDTDREDAWESITAAKAALASGSSFGEQVMAAMAHVRSSACATAVSIFLTSAICDGGSAYTDDSDADEDTGDYDEEEGEKMHTRVCVFAVLWMVSMQYQTPQGAPIMQTAGTLLAEPHHDDPWRLRDASEADPLVWLFAIFIGTIGLPLLIVGAVVGGLVYGARKSWLKFMAWRKDRIKALAELHKVGQKIFTMYESVNLSKSHAETEQWLWCLNDLRQTFDKHKHLLFKGRQSDYEDQFDRLIKAVRSKQRDLRAAEIEQLQKQARQLLQQVKEQARAERQNAYAAPARVNAHPRQQQVRNYANVQPRVITNRHAPDRRGHRGGGGRAPMVIVPSLILTAVCTLASAM